MKLKNFIYTILVPVFLLSFIQSSEQGDIIVGTWLVGTQKAKVEIFKKGEKYFGKIVWLSEPNNTNGTPKVDANNPDKTKRSQPIIGLMLLRDFVYTGKNTWEDGKIYDPESGKDYSCIITAKDSKTLDVRGYIGFSFIGRSETWTRQP